MNFKKELENIFPSQMILTEKEKERIRNRARQSHARKIQWKPIAVLVFSIITAGVLIVPNLPSFAEQENNANQKHATIPLTEEQKQEYYAEYVKIVDEAMKKKMGINIAVAPIEEFQESDWVTPKEYEKMVQDMIDDYLKEEQKAKASMLSNLKPAKTNVYGETIKSIYVYFPDIIRKIEVKATFDTQLNTESGRQLFSDVSNISSQLAGSKGTWQQTSVQTSILDGGRTVSMQIEGVFDLNNTSFEKVFTIEFTCDEFGNIY